MKVVVVLLAVLLVLASATACGEDEAGSPTPESLQDVPWLLASGVDVEGWEEVTPSATFMDGSVTGSTGCNRFTAPYTLDGGSLEIGQIASTRMACAPPADTVEREYVAALGQVKAWRSENDELTLLDADENDVLGYRVGTPDGSWQVTGIRQGDAIVSPIAETEITASFDEDDTLSGSAGCNTYTAAYSTNKGEIEITDPTSTKKACTEPEGIMQQEAAYLAALPTAVGFRVSGRSLELLTAEETPLVSYGPTPPP
jgi:heat shock protein HslJ